MHPAKDTILCPRMDNGSMLALFIHIYSKPFMPNAQVSAPINSQSVPETLSAILKCIADEIPTFQPKQPVPVAFSDRRKPNFNHDGAFRFSIVSEQEDSPDKKGTIFLGHYRQGGGFRIFLDNASDKQEPSHAIRVRHLGKLGLAYWEVDLRAAQRSRDLQGFLFSYNQGLPINKDAWPLDKRIGSVVGVIMHAIGLETSPAVIDAITARVLQGRDVLPTRTVVRQMGTTKCATL